MSENTLKQRMYQMSQDGDLKVISRGLYISHNLHNFHNYEDAKGTEVMGVMDSPNGSGIIQSERQVFEQSREHFGLNGKGGVA